jgi:hypothetical protein
MTMLTDKFTYLAGYVSNPSLGYMAVTDDAIDANEIPHSHLVFLHQGKWGNGGPVKFTVVGISLCTHPIRQMIAIGPFGEAFLSGTGDMHEERIQAGEDSPKKRGPLRHVRGIAGKVYAAGMQRQVYRRDDRDVWTCIGHSIRPARGQIVGFESIGGFGEDEIYAAGWEGEIWRYDGLCWHQLDSPTKLILHDICCAGDGNVYAGGQVGMLVAGRKDSWRAIEHGNTRENIWSLAWFNLNPAVNVPLLA